MKWYVWGYDANDAVENLYNCQEYKTKEEALRKRPVREGTQMRLYEVTAVQLGAE